MFSIREAGSTEHKIIITKGNTESISASDAESIISKLPKDALENVKGFLQEKREPLFFTIDCTHWAKCLKVSIHKDGFRLDYINGDFMRDGIRIIEDDFFPLFFKSKNSLVKYLIISHQTNDEDEDDDERERVECSLNANKTTHDVKCYDRQALKQLFEDYVDVISDGFRITE